MILTLLCLWRHLFWVATALLKLMVLSNGWMNDALHWFNSTWLSTNTNLHVEQKSKGIAICIIFCSSGLTGTRAHGVGALVTPFLELQQIFRPWDSGQKLNSLLMVTHSLWSTRPTIRPPQKNSLDYPLYLTTPVDLLGLINKRQRSLGCFLGVRGY